MKVNQNTTDLLNPARFPGMSPGMAAITGFILETKYTDPEITGLHITSDGFVFCSTTNDPFANDMIGSVKDLEANLFNLLDAASLSFIEKEAVKAVFKEKVQDWRIN